MKKTRKVLSIVLCLLMVGSTLAACGSKPAETAATTAAVETTAAAETTAAVEATDAVEAPEAAPETNVVTEAAMKYFAEFPEDRHMINVPDLFAKMDAEEDLLILDIRQADAYAEGHLKGAVNVPYGPAIADALELIPDDVPLYINCYTGQTSSQAVALLNMAGKYATNIQGGYKNGISTAEGFEKYTDNEVYELPEDTYEVDAEIKAAITDYFAKAPNDTFKYFNFTVEALGELVEAESDDYTILSIRKAEDFEKGHIAGAINIPFGKGMQESFSQIPTDKPVVIYCYSGQTSSQTLGILRMLGYEAYSLSGGMGTEGGGGWLGANLPVVTE